MATAAPGAPPSDTTRVRRLGSVALISGLTVALGGAHGLHALSGLGALLVGQRGPLVCAYKARTGRPCLGCGGTRALALMGRGEVRAAITAHPLGAWTGAMAWLAVVSGLVSVVSGRGAFLRVAVWLMALSFLPVLAATVAWWWPRGVTAG